MFKSYWRIKFIWKENLFKRRWGQISRNFFKFNKVHYEAGLRKILSDKFLMKIRNWSEHDVQESLSEEKECFGLVLMAFQRVIGNVSVKGLAWIICEIFAKVWLEDN